MIPGLAPRIGTGGGSLGASPITMLHPFGAHTPAGNNGSGKRRVSATVGRPVAIAQRHDRLWSVWSELHAEKGAKSPILLRDFNRQPLCASYVAVSDHDGAHLPVRANACNESIGCDAPGTRCVSPIRGASGWAGSYLPDQRATHPPTKPRRTSRRITRASNGARP
jgi:hypothetical protein